MKAPLHPKPPQASLKIIPLWVETFLFIVLFLLFEGYQFGGGNQTVFLPIIESIYKYPWLQNDFGVTTHTYYHPFLNHAMAWLGQWIQLPLLFLLTQILLLGLLYQTTRRLAAFLNLTSQTYWVGISLMFLWGQQGADNNVFWTNRLEAQYLAWPFILFAFLAYLRGRQSWAGFFTSVVLVFHFQMGIITGLALSVMCLFPDELPRRRRVLTLLTGGAPIAALVFCYFFKTIFFQHILIGHSFIDFATHRIGHHMALDIRLALLFLLLGLLPYTILKIPQLNALFAPSQIQAIRRLAPLQAILLGFGAFQYLDYYLHIGILSRLQFLRLLPFIYLTGLFFTAHFLLSMLISPKYPLRVLACLIFFIAGPRLITYQSLRENNIYIGIALIAAILFFWKKPPQKQWPPLFWGSLLVLTYFANTLSWNFRNTLEFKPASWIFDASQDREDLWVTACRAANDKTPQDALVISPPYLSGFGYYAKRKTFVEFKSGANHRDSYAEWLKRITLAAGERALANCSGMNCLDQIKDGYNALTHEEIEEIADLYHASFLITESNHAYSYKKIYSNTRFKLYQLPPSAGSSASTRP